MRHRRRVPRQPVGWEGTCHIVGDSAALSRECRVVDISMLGLGMTVEHPSPSELLGRRISVDFADAGDSFSIRLEGLVRNAAPTVDGVVRVGISFDGLDAPDPGTVAVDNMSAARDDNGRRRVRSH
jgi:hypothetical protein